jgi:hypothetical protein
MQYEACNASHVLRCAGYVVTCTIESAFLFYKMMCPKSPVTARNGHPPILEPTSIYRHSSKLPVKTFSNGVYLLCFMRLLWFPVSEPENLRVFLPKVPFGSSAIFTGCPFVAELFGFWLRLSESAVQINKKRQCLASTRKRGQPQRPQFGLWLISTRNQRALHAQFLRHFRVMHRVPDQYG